LTISFIVYRECDVFDATSGGMRKCTFSQKLCVYSTLYVIASSNRATSQIRRRDHVSRTHRRCRRKRICLRLHEHRERERIHARGQARHDRRQHNPPQPAVGEEGFVGSEVDQEARLSLLLYRPEKMVKKAKKSISRKRLKIGESPVLSGRSAVEAVRNLFKIAWCLRVC
jgi:hypothetical protein